MLLADGWSGRRQCGLCGKVLSSKYALQVHARDVHSDVRRNFSCRLCGKVYASQNSYRVHMSLKHRNDVHTSQTMQYLQQQRALMEYSSMNRSLGQFSQETENNTGAKENEDAPETKSNRISHLSQIFQSGSEEASQNDSDNVNNFNFCSQLGSNSRSRVANSTTTSTSNESVNTDNQTSQNLNSSLQLSNSSMRNSALSFEAITKHSPP